ncbi:MAG: UvrD-helicase domain-containing protein [Bacteroidota bacterium]|nr:UvrD-helicase domain-containing protein [Bacteroidota bacterium]
MDYLKDLNDAQIKAASQINGPMMVIAGAGSGKTKVLTYRIAFLLDNNVDAFNILALTFTNKAANEMKSRIAQMIGGSESKNLWMGTFHSIFARILRIEHEKIGYPSNFTIYDTQDSKSLLKSIVKEMGLDEKLYKPNILYNRISSAKNNLISAQDYLSRAEITDEDIASGRPKIGEVYLEYSKRCFKSGAMDFDDLLFKTNLLLHQHADVLLKYQNKFKYILVDEYQDTNYSQYIIVKTIAARFENICVVGDDAQSIYSFRGANIQNILNFKKDYPDYNLYKLEQNYRSTQNIVNAANSIIECNKNQIKKKVWTSNDQGELIKLVKSFSDNEEGKQIANDIFNTKNSNQANNIDFAILYRTNAQSRSFEEALRKLNLPYKIYGGLSFYQRKEIKDLLAYFRLTANHNDEESLKRIINYPKRGIGKTTIEKAFLCASKNDTTVWNVLNNPMSFGFNCNSGTANKIDGFTTMIKSFRTKIESLSAFELAHEIAKSSGLLNELYVDRTPEGIVRHENIQELLSAISEFSESKNDEVEEEKSLTDFLIDVALLTDADSEKEEDKNKITLMTIHAAKGLEFPYVYIVGMEENLFPSQMALNSRNELEEERRLFYVALTRAKKKATLSYAVSRYRWGNFTSCEPSRFIDEINDKYIEKTNFPNESLSSFSKKTSSFHLNSVPNRNLKKVSSSTGSNTNQSELKKIKIGSEVKHDKFGKGKVIEISGNSPNVKATVFFPSSGQKQLLLKFAKLQILN